jgi:hypothetical protein
MAKQFVKDPRFAKCNNQFPFITRVQASHTFKLPILNTLFTIYREGEGIPRFRRPRYIPASDTSSEPQLKKQKQDHTVDAGNIFEPDSI